MPELPIANFDNIIRQLYRPTVTVWNRLEGRARAEDFERAMHAEVRDALWMVSRQWQMGEFIGDDAGSPVLAKAHLATTEINKYRGGSGDTTALERDIPLEAKVENLEIPFQQGALDIALDLRLLMGRQWLRMISDFGAATRGDYIGEYAVDPPDSTQETDAGLCAHVKVWQQFAAAAGRCMDGYAFYDFLKGEGLQRASDDIVSITNEADRTELDLRAEKFINWFETLYYQPIESGNSSWRPEYLEHQFSCSAPDGTSEKVMVADEYYHGHLDWYNLDLSEDQTELPDLASGSEPDDTQATVTHSFIPTMVTFGGMPHPRWWKFENWKTDLSFIKPDTTDLNKLLLLEFMLVYANDWFIVPFTLPTGSIAKVRGLTVKNVFGENTWVNAAGAGRDEDWQRWNMYSMSVRGTEDVPADLSLAVLPVSRKVSEGKPVEDIYMLRDEVANMVWGVEALVPLATGKSKSGKEAGYELRRKLQQLLDDGGPVAADTEYNAKIRYQIANTVPEDWIPMIPVHMDGDLRQIQLQRAAMPRILENDDRVPLKIEPRTSLLRFGLDQEEKAPYFLHEEEVPRAGIRVRKSYQRTRWYSGSVYTWLGIRKTTGRWGGSSGLAFDQVVPTSSADRDPQ